MIGKMDRDEFYLRITKAFFEEIRQRPRGTMARLVREMGLSSSYFGQWKNGQRPPVGRLVEALNIMEVDVHGFFDKALSQATSEKSSAFSSEEVPMGREQDVVADLVNGRQLGRIGRILERKFRDAILEIEEDIGKRDGEGER